MIISFAWTTSALVQGFKTATRRFWDAKYMEMWWRNVVKDNNLCQAFDRSPRYKGKNVGIIKVPTKPFLQPLSEMTNADLIEEGNNWKRPDGTTLWKDLDEYRELMLEQNRGDTPYVVKFSYTPLNNLSLFK